MKRLRREQVACQALDDLAIISFFTVRSLNHTSEDDEFRGLSSNKEQFFKYPEQQVEHASDEYRRIDVP